MEAKRTAAPTSANAGEVWWARQAGSNKILPVLVDVTGRYDGRCLTLYQPLDGLCEYIVEGAVEWFGPVFGPDGRQCKVR